jgi:hypothetical protein
MARFALSIPVALAALAGFATAQTPRSPEQPRTIGTPTFSSYDADRDGRITREESSTTLTLVGQFERLDRNADEALDEAEFARFEAEMDQGRDGAAPVPGESPIRPFPDAPTQPPPKKP